MWIRRKRLLAGMLLRANGTIPRLMLSKGYLGRHERCDRLSIWLRERGVSRIARCTAIGQLLLWIGRRGSLLLIISKC